MKSYREDKYQENSTVDLASAQNSQYQLQTNRNKQELQEIQESPNKISLFSARLNGDPENDYEKQQLNNNDNIYKDSSNILNSKLLQEEKLLKQQQQEELKKQNQEEEKLKQKNQLKQNISKFINLNMFSKKQRELNKKEKKKNFNMLWGQNKREEGKKDLRRTDDAIKQYEYLLEEHQKSLYDQNLTEGKRGNLKLTSLGENLFDTYVCLLKGEQVENGFDNDLSLYLNGAKNINLEIMQEEDMYLGDLVIQFPNPDHKSNKNLIKPITHSLKEKIISKSMVIFDASNQIELNESEIMVQAFYSVFETLQTHYSEEEEKQINSCYKQIKKLYEEIRKNKITQEDKEQMLNPNHPQSPFYKLALIESREKIKKIPTGGEFMQQQPLPDSIYQQYKPSQIKYLESKQPWKYTGNKTQDFLTLFRHFIWIRLIKSGFNLKNFISEDGKYIYTIIFSDDRNLQITAENDKMQKAIDFDLSDILSLEPVDVSLRPLRLNSVLWTDFNQKMQTDLQFKKEDLPSNKFFYLRKRIRQLLQSIDFKKIARETNTSQINNNLFEYGGTELINDEKINDQTWQLYYDYLLFINEQCLKIRKKYYYTTKEALKINRQEDPYYKFTKKPAHLKNSKRGQKVLQKQQEELEKKRLQHISQRKNKQDNKKKKRKQSSNNASNSPDQSQLQSSGENNGSILQYEHEDFDDFSDNQTQDKEDLEVSQWESDIQNTEQNSFKKKQDNRNNSIFFSQDQDENQQTYNKRGGLLPFGSVSKNKTQNQQQLKEFQKVVIQEQRELHANQSLKLTFNSTFNEDSADKSKEIKNKNKFMKSLGFNVENLNKSSILHNNNSNSNRERSNSNILQALGVTKAIQKVDDIQTQKAKYQKKVHKEKYSNIRMGIGIKCSKFINTKIIKLRRKKELAMLYKDAFITGLQAINFPFGKKMLKNMWDRENMQPIDPFIQYFRTPQEVSSSKQRKVDVMWKHYINTENGRVSLFSTIERLKLVNSTISKSLNTNYIIDQQLILLIFPLNDTYELYGKNNMDLFQPMIQKNEKEGHKKSQIMKQVPSQFNEQIQNINKQLEQENEQEKQIRDKVIKENEKKQTILSKWQINSIVQEKMQQLIKQDNVDNKKQKEFSLIQNLVQNNKKIQNSKQDELIFNNNPQQKNEIPQLQIQKYTKVSQIYAQEKLKNLSERWSFRISIPWYVPALEVQQYFGEKITLYFLFISFYCKNLLIIGIIGMVVFGMQIGYDSYSSEYVYITSGFAMLQTIWANLMTYRWKRQETIYSTQFGQSVKKQQSLANMEERPGFKGKYQRSLITDNLNSIGMSNTEKYMKSLVSGVVCLAIITVYFTIIVLLFFLTEVFNQIAEEQVEKSQGFFYIFQFIHPSVIFTALLSVILLQTFEQIYINISKILTDFENHQNFSDYENSYINKRFMLSFISISGPVFLIAFLNAPLGIPCARNDCFIHAQFHFACVFVCLFIMGLSGFIGPMISQCWQNIQKQKKNKNNNNIQMVQKQEEKNQLRRNSEKQKLIQNQKNIQRKSLKPQQYIQKDDQKQQDSEDSSESDSQEPQEIKILKRNFKKQDQNPRKQIQKFIERESLKEQYSESQDIYGTVDEYLEITVQFSVLVLFGVIFPISFLFAFIWNLMELQTDKIKMLKWIMRPIPVSESSIGNWNQVLELSTYISIISNAGIITYANIKLEKTPFDNIGGDLTVFLLVLIVNFTIKFSLSGSIGDIPFSIENTLKRQQYIIKSTIEQFKKVNAKKKKKVIQKEQETDKEDNQISDDENDDKAILERLEIKKLKQNYIMSQKVETKPFYKIFSSLLIPKKQVIDNEQSFIDIDTEDETESDEDNEDVANMKNKSKNIKKITKQQENKKTQVEQKIRRYLWLDSKIINQQGYVQRPLLMRNIFLEQKYIQQDKYEQKFLEQEQQLGTKFEDCKKKLHKKGRTVFLIGMKGQWFHGFRRVNQVKSMYNHVQDIINDQLQGKGSQNSYNKHFYLDLNNIRQIDLKNHLQITTLPTNQDQGYFRNQKWETFIDSIHTIKIKKMNLEVLLEEELVLPYMDDKLFNEIIQWQLMKDQSMLNIYLENKQFVLLTMNEVRLMTYLEIDIQYDLDVNIFQIYEDNVNQIAENNEYFVKINHSILFEEEFFSFHEVNKGYYARIYQDEYLCNLGDLIRKRKQSEFPYREEELLYFLELMVGNLQELKNKKISHGVLNPSNLIITNQNKQVYKIIGIGTLFQYNEKTKQITFSRKIEKQEIPFIPPEIIEAQEKELQYIEFNPCISDLYSLGCIILNMMTLGEFEETITKKKITVQQYIQKSSIDLINNFPILQQCISQMLEIVNVSQRIDGQKIIQSVYNNQKHVLYEPIFIVKKFQDRIMYQIKKHKQQIKEDGSLNHILYQTKIYIKLRMYDQAQKLLQILPQSIASISKHGSLKNSALPSLNNSQNSSYINNNNNYVDNMGNLKFDEFSQTVSNSSQGSPLQHCLNIINSLIFLAISQIKTQSIVRAQQNLTKANEYVIEQRKHMLDIYQDKYQDDDSQVESSRNSSSRSATTWNVKAKFDHAQMHIEYLLGILKFIQYDNDTNKKISYDSLKHFQKVLNRVKKNEKTYEFYTSSFKNFIRLMQTYIMLAQLLYDRNSPKQAANYIRQAIDILKSGDKICSEKIQQPIITFYFHKFTMLLTYTYVYQKTYDLSSSLLESVQQEISETCKNYQNYSKRSLLWSIEIIKYQAMYCDILLKQENDIEYQKQYLILKELLVEMLNQSKKNFTLLLPIIDSILHLFEFDTYRDQLVKKVILQIYSLEGIQEEEIDEEGANPDQILVDGYLDFLVGKLYKMLRQPKYLSTAFLRLTRAIRGLQNNQFQSAFMIQERNLENCIYVAFQTQKEEAQKEAFLNKNQRKEVINLNHDQESQDLKTRIKDWIELLDCYQQQRPLKVDTGLSSQIYTRTKRCSRIHFFAGNIQFAENMLADLKSSQDIVQFQIEQKLKSQKIKQSPTKKRKQIIQSEIEGMNEYKLQRASLVNLSILCYWEQKNEQKMLDALYNFIKSTSKEIRLRMFEFIIIDYKNLGFMENATLLCASISKFLQQQPKSKQVLQVSIEVMMLNAQYFLQMSKFQGDIISSQQVNKTSMRKLLYDQQVNQNNILQRKSIAQQRLIAIDLILKIQKLYEEENIDIVSNFDEVLSYLYEFEGNLLQSLIYFRKILGNPQISLNYQPKEKLQLVNSKAYESQFESEELLLVLNSWKLGDLLKKVGQYKRAKQIFQRIKIYIEEYLTNNKYENSIPQIQRIIATLDRFQPFVDLSIIDTQGCLGEFKQSHKLVEQIHKDYQYEKSNKEFQYNDRNQRFGIYYGQLMANYYLNCQNYRESAKFLNLCQHHIHVAIKLENQKIYAKHDQKYGDISDIIDLSERVVNIQEIKLNLLLNEMELQLNLLENPVDVYRELDFIEQRIISEKGTFSLMYAQYLRMKCQVQLLILGNSGYIDNLKQYLFQKQLVQVEIKVQIHKEQTAERYRELLEKKKLRDTYQIKQVKSKEQHQQIEKEEQEIVSMNRDYKELQVKYEKEIQEFKIDDVYDDISSKLFEIKQIFQKYFFDYEGYSFSKNNLSAQRLILKGDLFLNKKQFFKARKNYEKAEILLKDNYNTIIHPQFIMLYIKLADINKESIVLKFQNIVVLLRMHKQQGINIYIKEIIIKLLIDENQEILKIFDNYNETCLDEYLRESIVEYMQNYCQEEYEQLLKKKENFQYKNKKQKKLNFVGFGEEYKEDDYDINKLDLQMQSIENKSVIEILENVDPKNVSFTQVQDIIKSAQIEIQQEKKILEQENKFNNTNLSQFQTPNSKFQQNNSRNQSQIQQQSQQKSGLISKINSNPVSKNVSRRNSLFSMLSNPNSQQKSQQKNIMSQQQSQYLSYNKSNYNEDSKSYYNSISDIDQNIKKLDNINVPKELKTQYVYFMKAMMICKTIWEQQKNELYRLVETKFQQCKEDLDAQNLDNFKSESIPSLQKLKKQLKLQD